jgi:hypothetical protein
LKVFVPFYNWPVYTFEVPALPANKEERIWTAFCFNGATGLKDVRTLSVLSKDEPDVSICQSFYGLPAVLAEKP